MDVAKKVNNKHNDRKTLGTTDGFGGGYLLANDLGLEMASELLQANLS